MTTHETVSVGQFRFECGESIPNLELAYESHGEFTGDNAILVCHALTGSQHVARVARSATEQSSEEPRDSVACTANDAERDRVRTDGQARAWWDDIVGPGKAIDTTEQFVLCVNVPGSCYGSSGPASTNPETGTPYGTDFPAVTVEDWTRAQRQLLDELGVPRLQAVVGGSVGGMNVLEWVKRYPELVERAIPVATAARLDPQCVALDGVARRAITTDQNWNGGDYYGKSEPDDGLALARQLGHVMYLSKDSMERKFGRRAAGRDTARDDFPIDPAAEFFPYRDVESYLDYQSGKFVERFDANSYLYLTRAMDNYDLSAGCASDTDALSTFDGEVLVMSFTGDWHFTTTQSEALAEAFRAADIETAHHVIDSGHGHDAFLVEPENVGPPLADFIEHGVAGRAVTDTHSERGAEFAPVHASLFGN